VEAELSEEVPLEESRGFVSCPRTTEARMDREPAEIGDAAAGVCALEAHRPGTLAVDLDDEDSEGIRLGDGARDLRMELVVPLRTHRGEERLDVFVRDEPDQEVDVVRSGAPDGDHYAGSSCPRTSNRR
jgi:hypothetical protein